MDRFPRDENKFWGTDPTPEEGAQVESIDKAMQAGASALHHLQEALDNGADVEDLRDRQDQLNAEIAFMKGCLKERRRAA